MARLMKGHTWEKGRHRLKYPVFAQVKHDEIRCHVIVGANGSTSVEFLSFSEKPLANMHYFSLDFWDLSRVTGWNEFDLGFEVNGNFNDSYRWVRSTKGLPPDLLKAKVKFWLYDLPEHTGEFKDRYTDISQVVRRSIDLFTEGGGLHLPHGEMCATEDDVEALFKRSKGLGYEGLMVKTLDHLYERGKRTNGWLKMKPSEDADGIIKKLHEAICTVDQPELGLRVGDPLGRIGSVEVAVVNDNGEVDSYATPHGIPHDLGRQMYLRPQDFIGQWCEFKYMERDRQGGYRHPVFHRIREAKT